MNKKPSVIVIAALLFVNACGSRVGAFEEPVLESAPVVVDMGDASSSLDSIDESPTTTSTVRPTDGFADLSGNGVDELQTTTDQTSETTVPRSSTSTASSTTTTSSTSPDQQTTTTQPQVDVDLDALTEALRELEDLLGLFDSQVDSVDLDETEGETP